MATNKYRVVKSWDDLKGDFSYRLEIDNGEGKGWEQTIYTGDADWANREASHYKADIVEAKEDGTYVKVAHTDKIVKEDDIDKVS